MPAAQAHYTTAHGSKYLQQLCKHFAHKVEVDFTPTEGQAALPPGPATLRANADGLHMHVSAEDDAGLAQAKHIVEIHLVKFAFRENLERLDWQPA